MGKFVLKASTGGGDFFSWKGVPVGTTITGRFIGLFEGNVLNGRRTFYAKFRQDNGVEQKVNTPTVLERRLREEFEVNDILQVVYAGEVKGKQPMPTKLFDISKYEEEGTTAEVAVAASVGIAAAAPKIDLAAIVAAAEQPQVTKWDRLVKVLTEKNPKAAPVMLQHLKNLDAAEAESALENYLKTSGLLT